MGRHKAQPRVRRLRWTAGLVTGALTLGVLVVGGEWVTTGSIAGASPVTYNPDYSCQVPWLAAGQSATIAGTGVTVAVSVNNTAEVSGHYLYQSSNPAKDKTTLTFSPAVPAIQMFTLNHADAPTPGGTEFETLTFTGTGGVFTNAVTNQDGTFTYGSTGVGASTFSGMLSGLDVDYTFDAAGIGNSQRGSFLDMYISCVRLSPSTQTVTGTTGTAITPTSLVQTGFVGSMTFAVTSGTLPAGLSLDSTTGVISGTPTAVSSTTVTITGTGSTFGSATADVTFAITTPTVTFNANGGSGSMSSQTSLGAANLAPNTFTRSGYTFAGWNTAANGTGTAYANGASFPFASSVTLYAQWTALPAPAPPASAQSSEEPAPTLAPAVTSGPVGNLDPINNPQNAGVPAGGVPAGQSLLLVNGVPSGVRVVPNAPSAPTGLDVSGEGFFMRIVGRGGNGDPLGLGGQAQLVLQSMQSAARSAARSGSGVACVVGRPLAESSGTGFKAGTQVRLYLLPGTLLGTFAVDGSGGYSGSVPVPAGLPVGAATLQVNGYAPSGVVRSVSLGVQVVPARAAVNRSAATRVFFDPLSPVISKQGKRALNALAKRVGKSGKRTVVVGFVQETASTNNDESLSTLRARAVAAYLKSKGVKGAYQVRGEGIAGSGNSARRVNVTVGYQPGC